MADDLPAIDTSLLDALIDLKRERDSLRQRLARLQESAGQVTDVVLQRVRADYEARLEGIEVKAAPLKQQARDLFLQLKPLQDAAQGAFNALRLDQEELGFRHRLGEFDENEYRRRMAQLGEKMKGAEGKSAEISEIVARFVGAFDSPSDLAPGQTAEVLAVTAAPEQRHDDGTLHLPPEPPPAPEPPPPPPLPAAVEAAGPASAVAEGESPASEAPREEMEAEQEAPAPPEAEAPIIEVPPPPVVETTPVLPTAIPVPGSAHPRLVALDSDIEPPEHRLEPLTFIGRTPENHVRIFKPAVSRRHAQIAETDGGWLLKDLSSENGTYVNGQRIAERLLADGDRVQFGTSRFVFKTS